MTNNQANLIGTTTMLILTLMLVYAITCISCKPQDTTQKQHNFQVGIIRNMIGITIIN